ncbi:MAG TPA: hypothetical protein VM285_05345 [Polyangia bacterium]|nr:hypothetical protein [Polyangia bacterium]
MQPERRTNRSDNLFEALGLQLAATAKRGGFTSLVLAEGQGIPVASAGFRDDLEDIVAVAPSLAPDARPWQGKLHDGSGAVMVTVMPVNTGDGPLFLCAAGGHGREVTTDLLRGGVGICRILA